MNPHFITRHSCPGCGCRRTTAVFSRPYGEPALRAALENFYADVGRLDYAALLGADYVVHSCTDCGLHFQRDIPDDFLLARLYEEWISPQRSFERFHAHLPAGRHLEIARDVFLSLSLVQSQGSPRRALDYGCGWGEWGRMIRAFNAESWGTELSAIRRDACLRDGIRVVPEADLPAGSFDLINADQVFEHLPAPAATLRFLRTRLRAGGVIRLAVPNGWRIGSALRHWDRELRRPRLGRLNAIAPLEHLNGFTTRSLVRMAANQGLARINPPWSVLRRAFLLPPGLRAKLKQAALPFYLRSRVSTQLWFIPARSGPEGSRDPSRSECLAAATRQEGP